MYNHNLNIGNQYTKIRINKKYIKEYLLVDSVKDVLCHYYMH